MTQHLLNKDYLTFEPQTHTIKQFYSQEKDNQIQKQIIQLNNILETIKNMGPEQNKVDDQFDSGYQNDMKIEKINLENQDKKQQNIKEAEKIFNEGVVICQVAIESEDKAISNNTIDYYASKKKASRLWNLGQYQEAIECYDKYISINPQDFDTQQAKGLALWSLGKYQEAIECYDKTISINPKNDKVQYNKGIELDDLNRYQEAIKCYDKAKKNFAFIQDIDESIFKLITETLRKEKILDLLIFLSKSQDNPNLQNSQENLNERKKEYQEDNQFSEKFIDLIAIDEKFIQCGSNGLNLLVRMKVDLMNQCFEDIRIKNASLIGANFVR